MKNIDYIKERSRLVLAFIAAGQKHEQLFGRYDSIDSIIQMIVSNHNSLNASTSDEFNKITYIAPCNKNEDSKNKDKRIKTSIRRFIRRQLNISIVRCNDTILDRFGSYILSNLSTNVDDRIKILKGNNISKLYAATTVRTCMTGLEHKPMIEFYAINADKISLAILDNYARAFIWKTDEGINVFDRIYPASGDHVEVFRNWAKEKGYLLRSNPTGVVSIKESVGIEHGKYLHVTVNKNDSYPYLDTFRFGKWMDDKLILSNNKAFGNLELIRTNGKLVEYLPCEDCHTFFKESGVFINNKHICEKCYSLYCRCSKCFIYKHKDTLSEKENGLTQYSVYCSFICDDCSSLIYSVDDLNYVNRDYSTLLNNILPPNNRR
ncbi:MAG: hypothetical protein ACOYLO_00470 [Ferruginibacter sp.]